MSENLNKRPVESEEVDLVNLFNFFESKIKKVFKLIFRGFKSIFNIFIRIIRAFFLNIKKISLLLFIALAIGFAMDKTKDKVYYAEMHVRPNFDSKYELLNNINYYNSLIKLKDYEELSKRFYLSKEESESLVEFHIEPGPQTKNEQILAFNELLKPLDSTTKSKVFFKDFIEDNNILTADTYLVRARSTKYNVFKKLEKGLNKSVENTYSGIKRKKKTDILDLEEANLKETLAELKEVKATYLEVMRSESKKPNLSSNLGESLGIQIERAETKETELLTKEIEVLNKLNQVKKERVLNNTIFDNLSTFKEKGLVENIWYKKFKIIIPLFVLSLLFLFYVSQNFYRYVLKYKL